MFKSPSHLRVILILRKTLENLSLRLIRLRRKEHIVEIMG